MSKRFKEQGYVSDFVWETLIPFILYTVIKGVIVGAVAGFLFFLGCMSWESSEQNVSGIVYNTSNNNWPSGNTNFSIRADVNAYVDSSNESSYCLPPNSPYKELVNKAAADKTIKVVVTTSKYFEIKSNPLVCVDNVKVTEVKK